MKNPESSETPIIDRANEACKRIMGAIAAGQIQTQKDVEGILSNVFGSRANNGQRANVVKALVNEIAFRAEKHRVVMHLCGQGDAFPINVPTECDASPINVPTDQLDERGRYCDHERSMMREAAVVLDGRA